MDTLGESAATRARKVLVSRGTRLLVGLVSVAPSVVLATVDARRSWLVAIVVLALAQLAKAAAHAWARSFAASYFCRRLLSARYLVPAVALPLASGAVLARGGALGACLVVALHLGLAERHRSRLERPGAVRAALVAAALGGLFVALEVLALSGQEWRLGGRLLYAEQTPRQRVVLVERAGSIDFFIDGELQLRTADERLYHEGLLAPALSAAPRPRAVLVMGGGDGLATRDLLQCPRVERVVIVDWDPVVVRLFRDDPLLASLNEGALLDPRTRVVHRDVRALLAEPGESFDLVVGDLTDPDPRLPSGSGLLTAGFFTAVRSRLAPGGVVVTHASSADGADAVRAIHAALREAGFTVHAYRREVSSFGTVAYLVGSLDGAFTVALPEWAEPLALG